MKIHKHILYVFLLLLLGTSLFIYSNYENARQAKVAAQWVNQAHRAIEKINFLHASITDLESEVRGYIISGNPVFLQETDQLIRDVNENLQELVLLGTENLGQQGEIAQLQPLVKKKLRFQQEILANYKVSPTQALQLISSLRGKELSDDMEVLFEHMREKEDRVLSLRIAENEALTSRRFTSSVWVGCCAFFVFTYGLFRINRENRLRRTAQKLSSRSEAKYRGIIENSAVVIYTTNATGYFTYVSSKCVELTEYLSEDMVGMHFTDIIEDSWKERVTAFYLDQVRSGTKETLFEFRLRTKSGRESWVEQSATMLLENGKPAGFQCIVKDITQKKLAEEQLRKAEQQMQSIIDNVPMIMYTKDLEGRYLMVNRHFREILQQPVSEVVGRKAVDLQKIASLTQHIAGTDEEVKTTLQAVEVEMVLNVEGEDRHLLMLKFPLMDSQNRLFAIGGVSTDITEIVRSRNGLIKARTRAEQAEKLQEEFLANMSHEIRTPMNGIVGMTNLLLDTSLNEQQKEYLRFIRQSSDTLLVLINDILDFSKIKAGKMTLEKLDFPLKDVVEQATRPMQPRAAAKQVGLSSHIRAGVPLFLKGDPYRLEQILNNLVSNAVKFTDKGTVHLEVAAVETGAGTCTLEFTLTDTGIGMEEKDLLYIFESFSQVAEESAKKLAGTGLGLAITKKLVDLQGGTITVQSKPGAGTTFRFRIPYALSDKKVASNAETIVAHSYEAYAGLAGKRILLVEDNLINQKVAFNLLKKVGIVTDIAGDGREAVSLMEKGEVFDLVIMDLQMPEMDGFQAAAYIRRKLKSSVPIIAMTASALRNERVRCMEVGMNEYMTKPFVPADLFNQLNRFLKPNTMDTTMQNASASGQDLYSLHYLIEMGGHEYLSEVLQLFLDTTPEIITDLKAAALHENWDETGKLAHKMKSSVSVFQMNGLVNDVATIEHSAKQKTGLEAIPGLIHSISNQFDLIRPMIEAELAESKRTNA